MPDDPIQTTAASTSRRSNGAAPPPAPPAAGVTRQEFDSAIGDLKGGLQSINEFFDGLKKEAQVRTNAMQQPQGMTDEDFNTNFYNDPRGTIAHTVAEQALPVVSQNAKAISQIAVNNHRDQIDATYGPGTWDEIYQPKLGPVIEQALQTNPVALLDSTALDNAVKSISGDTDNMTRLFEKKGSYSQTQEEQQTASMEKTRDFVLSTSNMTGGIRRVSTDNVKLDDEQKSLLKTITSDTGKAPNENRLATMINTGNTLEDWAQANDKLGGDPTPSPDPSPVTGEE